MAVTLKITLDKRRTKLSGLYPVKLKVTFERVARYYPCNVDLSEEDLELAMSHKPPKEFREHNLNFSAKLGKAKDIVDDLKFFTWDAFESMYLKGRVRSSDSFSYYDTYMSELREAGKVGTEELYRLSKESIIKFLKHKGRKATSLNFHEITVSFLNEYERYMLSLKRSTTTISIYLRNLRTLFNRAIEEGNAMKESYPFGKRRYQVPGGRKRKSAVSKGQLHNLLMSIEGLIPEQQKAKEFWFFSYACNGINLKDIALLKWPQIEADRITFVRAKTSSTSKGDQKEIVVFRNEYIDFMLAKYAVNRDCRTGLVFDILKDESDPIETKRNTRNFVRFINQHMKNLAEKCGISEKISFNWARHSFTTKMMMDGATLELMQECLGHQSKQTTMNYWAGFDDDTKRNVARTVMNF